MSIRALLSFLRPTKASVEPVSRTDDLRETAPALDVLVKREHTFETDRLLVAIGAPIKDDPGVNHAQHPLAPEREAPQLDWESWRSMQRETFRRGWSFCRYAVRTPDRMACVFGIVRGPWGIAKMDFYICGSGTVDTLNAITHLPSGMGCGLFTDLDAAVTACEIATRLTDDWETLDPYADASVTREAIHRMHVAWAAAGLTKCATHAHATADRNTDAVPIWFQDHYNTVIAGRPEGKLS